MVSGDCVLLLPIKPGEEYSGVPDLELPNETVKKKKKLLVK